MAELVRSAANATGERRTRPAAIVRYPATPAPRVKFACVYCVLRKVEEIERQRTVIRQQIAGWENDDEIGQAPMRIAGAQVRTMLTRLACEMRRYEREALRAFPGSIVDRIDLDPNATTLRVCCRIPLRSGQNVASPATPPHSGACGWNGYPERIRPTGLNARPPA